MHPILIRQLRRFLEVPSDVSLPAAFGLLQAFLDTRQAPPELCQLVQGLAAFVGKVNATYTQFDRDIELLSRSLYLSSQEQLDINEELHSTLLARETAITRLRGLAMRLQQTLPPGVDSEAGGDDNLANLIGLITHLVERQEAHQAELLAIHTDLAARTTEVLTANDALRESEERFRKLFEDTRQATLLIEDGRFIAANQAAMRLLGVDRLEAILGRTPADFSPVRQPDGRSSADKNAELIHTACATGSNTYEWELLRVDGAPCFIQTLLTVIHQGDRELLHVVFSDITEQKQAHERIEFLAYHDALTGLPNRVLGQERLRRQLAHASDHQTSLAVVYLDMDRFKYINDTHGHILGDRLLQCVAERLTRWLGVDDTLCHLSADEFMLLMPVAQSPPSIPAIASRCERLLAKLAEPFDLDGRQLHTTFSLGVALYPQDGTDDETLMRNADTALFEAKRAGRQTYRCFAPHMNDELKRLIQTRDALRCALDRQEFELHYQPQLDLCSNRLVGVEALIRWRRPGMGLLMPGTFIDVAEETGLIAPIGRWVLGEACRQAAAWRAAGWQEMVMAVNISPIQFRQGELVQDVLTALEESGLDPSGLDLELTESLLLQGESSVLVTLAQWKALGIQLSIDDFGTGYSNLAYLKRFKVDRLKIDRSFVVNLLDDEEDRAITQAMIQIAHSLNIKTIAEGVEDRTLAEQLKSMGCDEVQGYLYSRPLPAVELEQWLTVMDRTDNKTR